MPDELTRATFAPHAGSSFRVVVGDEIVGVTLGVVGDLRSDARSETFSLVFVGPADAAIPQGEYRFEHDVIGDFSLFVVPIGREDDSLLYEAVFNRLRPA